MKKFLCAALALLFLASTAAGDGPKKPFPRGAKPTPRHKLVSAKRHVPGKAAPVQYAVVPAKLDMWGNDTFGDCVTAEEAFAKACYQPEIFIDSATVVAWATAGGFRDGANLTDVMDAMAKVGFVAGKQTYNDGGYALVDYTSEAVLQSAISQGPVKLGIDANALPTGAGNQQGWVATGGTLGQFANEDHCVSLSGYGTAQYLFAALNVPLPQALQPTQTGYLLFTWSTIGFVDHAWIMSTCGEAWVRSPTTVGVPPLGPTPPPPPPPGGNPTLVSVVATFSDGSTQTLTGAPGSPGLTPAQLQSMTLQQITDWINKQGKGKTPPPAPMPKPAGLRWQRLPAVTMMCPPASRHAP